MPRCPAGREGEGERREEVVGQAALGLTLSPKQLRAQASTEVCVLRRAGRDDQLPEMINQLKLISTSMLLSIIWYVISLEHHSLSSVHRPFTTDYLPKHLPC